MFHLEEDTSFIYTNIFKNQTLSTTDIIIHNRSTNRYRVSGGKNKACNSMIAGYYNKCLLHHNKYFRNKYVCRKCRLNEFSDQFLRLCTLLSDIYRQLDFDEWFQQKQEYDMIDDRFKIPNSVFTTVTLNYNLQCLPHFDKGNFRCKSIMLVLGDFEGGELVIDGRVNRLKNNDVIVIDGTKLHYNLPIKGNRISLVFYIRENMSNKKNEVQIGKHLYLTDS